MAGAGGTKTGWAAFVDFGENDAYLQWMNYAENIPEMNNIILRIL